MFEIEKKFLVINNDWQNEVVEQKIIKQGYLFDNTSNNGMLRIRQSDNEFYLTIKYPTEISGKVIEIEKDINKEEFDILFTKSMYSIEKIRNIVPCGKYKFEIDVFQGKNTGLIIAEIELEDINTHFFKPKWLGKEVTHDEKYLNINIAKNNFIDTTKKIVL